MKLDRCHRRAEDIGVQPVVVPELELGRVEPQVLRCHLAKGANRAALELAQRSPATLRHGDQSKTAP